jgi:hypothetical protein
MSNDIVIRAKGDSSAAADNEAIKQVREIGGRYIARDNNGERLRIHLILHNQSLVNALRRTPLEGWMKDNIELYAYSYSDLVAINLLGIMPNGKHRLDFEPVKLNDNKTIHLVLVGLNRYTESLAIHTALVAHYPNYCRDNGLSTRITIVGENMSDFDNFKHQYKNLICNSYCREVKLTGNNIETKTIAPKYANTRNDIVDIEWEFVASSQSQEVQNYKFEKWANDESQLTTFIFSDDNESANLTNALNLANSVTGKSYQIFIKAENSETLSLLQLSGRYGRITAFSDASIEQTDFKSIIRMAQLVNFAYNNMQESTTEEVAKGQTPMVVATEMPSDELVNKLWNRNDANGNPKLNTQKRWSNLYAAFSIPTKLRSIGIDAETCHEIYAINDADIETLAETEHNRWCVEELILGFEPTTDKEHNEIVKDISKRNIYKNIGKHDDLRNFKDLGEDQNGKSVVLYDIAIVRSMPLIVYSFNHQNGEKHGNR